MEVDTERAERSDKLDDTVNYQDVYLLVKSEMEIKAKLLEHVGRRILDAVMQRYPEVTSAEIKISKMNPPLGGKIKNVSLSMRAE